MDISKFRGTGVAIVTPFKTDGSVDFNALKNIVNFQIDNGVNFIVALGTTGEPATLNDDEKQAVIDFIIEVNKKRVPIVVGCGGNNTAELIKYTNQIEQNEGVDAILSVAPYYNKPNQTGIFEHFKALAKSTKLPIILYNVPGRTASNINEETTLKLANQFDNIIGIKEASGNFSQMMQIVKNRPDNFLILSGDDATALPLISLGFDGVISVISNAYPKEFTEMIKLSLQGDFNKAKSIHYSLLDIINTMFEEGNPTGVKAYMKHLNLIEDNLRLPLVSVSEELNSKIKILADNLK